MQIPENFKKMWFWLATVAIVIVLAFLVIVGIKLAHNNSDVPATITVNGKGEVKATPDVSRFSVTVEETAKDQSTALAQTSTKVNAVMDSLKKLGIAEKDIKTEYTSVNPKYEYQKGEVQTMMYPPVYNGNQVITGYTSSHTLSIKVRDLTKVSGVQKILADAKVQNIAGPDLSIDDPDALQLAAREKAIDDATGKAEILAEQLHVHLGKVVSFSDSNGGYPMPMYARADAMMGSAPKANPEPEIATGEQTITSNVSITYKIR